MTLVIFVRHGQTDDNISGRISGQGPIPLNTRGREQTQLVAEVLVSRGVTHLFSSPVMRALQTAEILAIRLDLGFTEIAELREVGYGEWEGRSFGEIRSHAIAQQVFHDPVNAVFPHGESLRAVQQRGVRVVEAVRQTYPRGVIVLVSHGDVIRTTLAHYLGLVFNDYRRIHIDNGALSVLELRDSRAHVKAVNFVPQADQLQLESFYETWQKTQQLVPIHPTVTTNGIHQHPAAP